MATPLRYVVSDSDLGPMLLAASDRGLCEIAFGDPEDLLRSRDRFADAEAAGASDRLRDWSGRLHSYLAGEPAALSDLPLDLAGSPFQLRVWQALRRLRAGETVTYGDLAGALGSRTGARAVARACAANRIALAIPCHRVVPKGGGAGGYRWGSSLKRRLLELEGVRLA